MLLMMHHNTHMKHCTLAEHIIKHNEFVVSPLHPSAYICNNAHSLLQAASGKHIYLALALRFASIVILMLLSCVHGVIVAMQRTRAGKACLC